jgi:hypothetical protein
VVAVVFEHVAGSATPFLGERMPPAARKSAGGGPADFPRSTVRVTGSDIEWTIHNLSLRHIGLFIWKALSADTS